MTSLLAETSAVLGAQRPRVCSHPPAVSSTGQEAIDLAALAGLDLDPWQQFVLRHSLGEREDGNWAAREVAVVVGRQNGKNVLLEARELAGLFLLGEELIIHSAHLADTSNEAFRRLWGLIENTPELSKRVLKHSQSHGAEGIELKSGQRIRFRTRTKGGGRGWTCDCLILDEAMIVSEAMTSAVIPTLSTRKGMQVWYTGSAVDQDVHEHGLVLARVRERGIKGDPHLAYFEWSVPGELRDLTPQTIADPYAWAQANPALGIRISEEYVQWEMESNALGHKGFAVERLGIGDWPDTGEEAGKIIKSAQWKACEDATSQAQDPVCFAFDVNPERTWSSIAVAGDRADGGVHVEVVEHRPGTSWVVERLAALRRSHRTFTILCDPAGPAGSLLPEAVDAVGKNAAGESYIHPVAAREMASACGVFFDAVTEARLRHLGQSELDSALNGAGTRPLSEAWAWSRKNSSVDISPLVAVTLALYGNSTRPKAKSRVINLNTI